MSSELTGLMRIFEPIRRRIALMVRRAVIDIVKDENPVQVMQLKFFKGECRKGIERIQEFGFSSVPLPEGQVIAACVDGECGHELVIATDDRRYRPTNMQPGQLMLYTQANKKDGADTEHHLFFDPETRHVRIRAKTIELDADEKITLRAPDVVAETNELHSTGESSDKVRTMSGDREIYNSHGHPDASPPPDPEQ